MGGPLLLRASSPTIQTNVDAAALLLLWPECLRLAVGVHSVKQRTVMLNPKERSSHAESSGTDGEEGDSPSSTHHVS